MTIDDLSNRDMIAIWAMVLSLVCICLTIIVGVVAIMAYARLYSTHQIQFSPVDEELKNIGGIEEDDFSKAYGAMFDDLPDLDDTNWKGPEGGELMKNMAEAYGYEKKDIQLAPKSTNKDEEQWDM